MKDEVEKAVRQILKALGQDLEREGLRRTPQRIAEMYERMTRGYDMEVALERTYTGKSNVIIEPDIPFVSLCEHHLAPFFGTVSIAYIPHQYKVTGLSKLDQLVQKYALRLQLQERMTQQIADELHDAIQPKGVMVVSRATHTCKLMEGFSASEYVVSVCKGVFLLFEPPRLEVLLSMLGGKQS